jgi:cell division protein FtsQ
MVKSLLKNSLQSQKLERYRNRGMKNNTDNAPNMKRGSKKKEIAGFLLLLIGIVIIGAAAYSWQEALSVDVITVEGNRIVPAEEIISRANIITGSKISKIELSVVHERILKNAFIKNVTVRRDLPGTIVISVIERTPVALINANQLMSCDAEGIVMPHIVSSEIVNLPVISGIRNAEDFQPGETIKDSAAREALRLLLDAAEIDSTVFQLISEIRQVNGGELLIYTTDCSIPVMIGRGRIAEKVVMLSSFWRAVVRPGTAERIESVDVRFQDQVVVRWAGNARTSTQPG